MTDFTQKVLSKIADSQTVRKQFNQGYGNYCSTTSYHFDSLTVVLIHNGCDSACVEIRGTSVGTIPTKIARTAIAEHEENYKNKLINAL